MQDDAHRGVGREHVFPGQQPVSDATGRVDVGASIELGVAKCLLGCDECRCSLNHVIGGQGLPAFRLFPECLHESEIQYLDEVAVFAIAAEKNIRRFDVAMNEPACLRFRKRVTDLSKQIDGAIGRHGPEAPHECIGVESVEELHRVVEGAILRHTEIEELHGVWRSETRDGLGFVPASVFAA